MTHLPDGTPITGVYAKLDPPDWRVIVIDGDPFKLEGKRRAVLWRRFESILSGIADYPAALDEQGVGYRLTDESVEVKNADPIEKGDAYRLTMSDGSTRAVPAGLLKTLLKS
jgi:hypothetical protein